MAVFWAGMDDPRATSTQVGPAEGPEAADMHVQTPRPVTCRAVGFLGDLGFLSLFGLKNTSFHLYKLNESMTRPATPDDQICLQTPFFEARTPNFRPIFGRIGHFSAPAAPIGLKTGLSILISAPLSVSECQMASKTAQTWPNHGPKKIKIEDPKKSKF